MRLAKGDSLGSKTGGAGGRRRVSGRAGSGFGLPRHAGAGRLTFFLGNCGTGLGVDGFSRLLAKPGGAIDLRVNGQRGGLVRRRNSAAIRDQAFDGHDHCEGLDLAGNAAAGHFGAQVGDFPESGQNLLAAQILPAQFLGILLDELLLNGGPMLKHIGTDTRLGFGVGSGIGVKTDGFGGTTVGHGSREDQAGKGYFLIGDEVGDFIFGHRWLRGVEKEKLGTLVRRERSRHDLSLGRIKKPAAAGCL